MHGFVAWPCYRALIHGKSSVWQVACVRAVQTRHGEAVILHRLFVNYSDVNAQSDGVKER